MPVDDGTIAIDGANVQFRNFAGREGMYNAEGDRNFCVILDGPDDAALVPQLEKDGWNIKYLKPRADDEVQEARPYIQVSLKYKGRNGSTVRPPTVVMITSGGRTSLDEDGCEILDYVDVGHVDVIIRPYQWAVNGNTGVKAYLKAIYLTVAEDAFEARYRDLPELRGGAAAITAGDEDIWEGELVDEDQKALEA